MLSADQKANIVESLNLAKAAVEAADDGEFTGMLPSLQVDICQALCDMTDELILYTGQAMGVAAFGEVPPE